MRKSVLTPTALAALMAAALIAAAAFWPDSNVLAQPEPEGDQPQGFRPAQPRFPPGAGGPGRPAFRLRAAALGGGAALAVSGDRVFVLRGNTLYQFAADDLKLLKKVTLEAERPFGPPGGWRGGFGPGPLQPPGRGERPERGRLKPPRPEPRDRQPQKQAPGERPSQAPAGQDHD